MPDMVKTNNDYDAAALIFKLTLKISTDNEKGI